MVAIYPMDKIIFELSYDESKKAREWIENHKLECSLSEGTIGDRFSYSFTPTGIGVLSSVKCACGESFIITDMSKL